MASARAKLAEWVRTYIEGLLEVQDRIRLPDVKMAAIKHFNGDQDFKDQLFRESMPALVYDVVQQVVAITRPGVMVRMGPELVNRAAVTRRAFGKPFWERWLEQTGGGHERLYKMNRAALLEAAQRRRKRGYAELAYAAFYETLAGRLPDEVTEVGSFFKEEELEQAYSQAVIDAADQAKPWGNT